MDERIKQIAQEVYNSNSVQSQFSVANIPFHAHNGSDAPRISTKDLVNPFVVGTVALKGLMPRLDCSQGNIFTITLSGNTTFNITGVRPGMVLTVEVIQGTGTSYTNTWWSGITWVTTGGTAPVQTAVSNGVTIYGFRALTAKTFYGYLVGTN